MSSETNPNSSELDLAQQAAVLWCVGLLVLAAQVLHFWGHTVDDAYISFRYAYNLLHHGRLAHNLEGAPVEGYTNLLWTLICSPGTLLEDPLPFARVLGLVSLAGSVGLLALLARRLMPDDPRLAPLAVCVGAGAPGWAYWQVTGMEVPLVGALLLLGLWLQWRDHTGTAVGSWVAWGPLLLTRADAFVLVATAIAVRLAARFDRRQLEIAARDAAFAMAFAVAQIAFRVAYYDDWMPNTYYAKLDVPPMIGRGLSYAAGPLRHAPLLLLAAGAPIWAWRCRSELHRFLVAVAALLAVQVAYVSRTGGDWMPLYRYVAPLVPVAALAAAAVMIQGTRRLGGRIHAVAILVLAMGSAVGGTTSYTLSDAPLRVIHASEVTELGRLLGRALAKHNEPTALLADGGAGATPYFSRLRYVDMAGLSDAHIARTPAPRDIDFLGAGHLKGDGHYVLEQRPDVIVFLAGRSDKPGPYKSDVQMAFSPHFYANYELREFTVPRAVACAGRFVSHLRNAEMPAGYSQLELREAAFGFELWRTEEVSFAVFQRTASRTPSRALMARVAEEADAQRWEAAWRLLEKNQAMLAREGFGHVVHPISARLMLLAGRPEIARRHIAASPAAMDEEWRGLFAYWLRLDPSFEQAGVSLR